MPWKSVTYTEFCGCCKEFDIFADQYFRSYIFKQTKGGLHISRAILSRSFTLRCCPFCRHDFTGDTVNDEECGGE